MGGEYMDDYNFHKATEQAQALYQMINAYGEASYVNAAYGDTGYTSAQGPKPTDGDFEPEQLMKTIKLVQSIQRIMQMMGNADAQDTSSTKWRKELLTLLRPQVNEEKRYIIDMMSKLIEIEEIRDKHGKGF